MKTRFLTLAIALVAFTGIANAQYRMTIHRTDNSTAVYDVENMDYIEFDEISNETPAYDQIYFTGDINSWNFDAMTKDALDSFLFRYGHYFDSAGEFKFGTSSGEWNNMYEATSDKAPYTSTAVEFVSDGDHDYKWYLTDDDAGKAYKICLDIRSGKERMLMSVFTPYEMIYLTGDATTGGWSLDDATAMTATDSPYVFTWTGELNSGELKFTCDRQSDFNGAWFLSEVDGQAPTGQEEHMLFLDKSSQECAEQYIDINIKDVDHKWKVEAGTYSITLNQLEETITIAKQ